jgi:hypothetical protein
MRDDGRPQFDEGFERRRNHANIEAMQNLIIDAVTRETTHQMPPLVRNFVSALQSSHGGGKVARDPFTRSHIRVASYMQFKGDRPTKEQRVRRLINRLEDYQSKTGYLFFLVKRGGEPIGTDERGTTIYSATSYTDFLKLVADAAAHRARASDLWKANPGDALAAQVAWALAQLPIADRRPEEEGKVSTLPLAEYERQSEERIKAAVEKRADGIAERGGDASLWLEHLEVQISRLRRSRTKTAGVARLERMREREEDREDQNRTRNAEIWAEDDAEHSPTKVIPPPAANTSVFEDTPNVLAAALDYAARGFPVFPTKQNKAPHTTRGFKDATCDEAMIREWWCRWSDAGIGIPTGVASGWLVLDSDPRHGGDVSLCELIEEYGDLPETLEAETGGGGHHIIFEYPELAALGNSRGGLPEGLDVRGEGGYIIAAPTLHASGKRYRWRNDFRPAPVPHWLLRLLTEEKPPSCDSKPRPQAKSGEGGSLVITKGSRNETLFKRGSAMRGDGLECGEIEERLLELNARLCSPPLPELEVLKIARSAARYAPNCVTVGA